LHGGNLKIKVIFLPTQGKTLAKKMVVNDFMF